MNPQTESTLQNYDNEIQTIRTQINLIDEKIVSLLKERLQLVLEAREVKKIDGLPQHSSDREQVVVANATAQCSKIEKAYVEQVYSALLETTRNVADAEMASII